MGALGIPGRGGRGGAGGRRWRGRAESAPTDSTTDAASTDGKTGSRVGDGAGKTLAGGVLGVIGLGLPAGKRSPREPSAGGS